MRGRGSIHTYRVTRDKRLLRTPFREIRAVREREDGPWRGVLVRVEPGGVGVLVDAEDIGSDWLGWDATAGGHVLCPIDVVRRDGGHDVLLPVCAERLEDFVRRRSARSALLAGEAVTLGVSILRGCTQIAGRPDATGDWWLDDSGRPILATDTTSQRAFDAAVALLTAAAVDPLVREAWDAAIQALSATRVSVREITGAEEMLFQSAAPEPLSTVSLHPRTAVEVAVGGRSSAESVESAPPRPLWRSLMGSVDADLADAVSRATTAIWRRLRRPKPARRAPWVVGGGVAAAVLAGGALWPAAGGAVSAESSESRPTTNPTTVPDSAAIPAAPAPTVAPAAAEGEDFAAVAGRLLDSRTACEGDVQCLSAVVTDPAKPLTSGTIDLPADRRALTLLDDFGDMAVLRADPKDGASPGQLIVLVRRDEKWLLRDVHDVAQQP
jgi:hypothetical protein